MKTVYALAAGTALTFATAAVAQDAATPPADETAAAIDAMQEEAPAAEATAETTAEVSFTDAQIASFAAAAIEIQALEGDAAAKQQGAAEIVAKSDIDAETFNAISVAMQSDPEVANRVQLAAAALQEQPAG